MINRREFLEAAAASALPAIAGTSLGGTATSASEAVSAGHAFHLMLFDARYSAAQHAAARISRAGAAVHALSDGDITQVWLNEIGPIWQRGAAAIVGLTARPALFCLEQLALGSGLRVVFHTEHVLHGDGWTEHSLLRGAESLGLSASDLSRAGPDWSLRVADALVAYRPQPGRARFGRSDAALEPALPPQAQLLTSWIIAAA